MTSPIRVLRQLVRPTGRHRPRPPLLPDAPLLPPAGPTPHGVLDEDTLALLLHLDEVVATESAHCERCGRSTAHAMHRDGSRACWTCHTETPAGGAT
ncbi:hypothetical protein [Streptomyces longispororuber]|uniref:hypothetical protein n=1 Tax=Streptomyces longispororuber TaxID=68230 RepID=UPI0036F75E56